MSDTYAAPAVALPETFFNPYGKFTFTDTDEWLNTLRQAVLTAFPNVESVSNLHYHSAEYRHDWAQLDLKNIDWYRMVVFAEPGGSEGYYVTFRAEHRKSNVEITLLSCKVLNGLDYAIDIAGFITRCLFTWR